MKVLEILRAGPSGGGRPRGSSPQNRVALPIATVLLAPGGAAWRHDYVQATNELPTMVLLPD
jgi:hypothetical protein